MAVCCRSIESEPALVQVHLYRSTSKKSSGSMILGTKGEENDRERKKQVEYLWIDVRERNDVDRIGRCVCLVRTRE